MRPFNCCPILDSIAVSVLVNIGLDSIRAKDPNNHSDTETGTLSIHSTQKPWGKPSSPWSTIIVWIINSIIMVIKPCQESVQTVLSKWPLLSSSFAPFSNSYPPQLAGHGQQFYTCSPLNSEQDFASKYFTQSRSDHRLNTLSASCCINFAHITFHNHMVKIFTRFSTSQIEAVLSRTLNIIDMSLAAQPPPIVVTICPLLLMKRSLQNLSSKYLRGY